MKDWQVFDIQITPHSPLQLGNESLVGNFQSTGDCIPGAVLRGAIAERLMAHCSRPEHLTDHHRCPDRADCPFWQVFGGEREPLFGFAYPGRRGPAYPFPLTARTCKRYGGYEADDGRVHHGVYDLLLDRFFYEMVTDPWFPAREALLPEMRGEWPQLRRALEENCPLCGGPLSRPVGTYVAGTDGVPDDAGILPVRRIAHVGINRARGVAEDGLLYVQEVIEPAEAGLAFHARITVPAAKAEVVRPSLDGAEYVIGRGRSRGLGRVRIAIRGEHAGPADLQTRLEVFQRAARAVRQFYAEQDHRIGPETPGTLFSLTLRSPAIFEVFGQPRIVPTPAMLGLPPEVRLVRAWARPRTIGGWNTAAGLPRRTRLAAQAGSVYLFWAPPGVEGAALVDHLRTLEVEGVGEERARGYGQVTVCAPFHVHNRLGAMERSQR